MSQTPRKFSEKIAILERKTRAENDDFMSIMQDVKKITSTGPVRSPQTTPSSTPYPCSPTGGPGSSSAIHTPSAIESPIDSNNLHALHPLAGMPWQRTGGSLPNVYQMVQQKPGMMPQMTNEQYQNWLYWQSMPPQSSGAPTPQQNNHHPRTRSPGSAAHYHPYRSSSGNVAAAAAGHGAHRNERIPPLESHMMSNNVHLQPPDPSWSTNRARSDPAIHMNTMNALYYNPQPNAQFSQQQQFQLQQQQQQHSAQQQWAQQQQQQMPNGMMGQGPQQFYTNGPTCTTPTGAAPAPPQTPNSQPGSTASSASSVPISMSSPQHQPNPQQAPQMQYNNGGGYLKQSPCGSPDMAVGSLPNMHSPMLNQGQQFKNEPSSQPPSNYYDYDYDSQQQQQPLQSAPATMPAYCNGGSMYSYNQPTIQQSIPQQQQQQYIRPQHQLTMPQGMGAESSQSAPTSPAQSYAGNPLQPQWTPTRHYSASPDNMGGIPRVTLTRVEGNTECFQEFQDLCLDVDNDLQQALIQGAEDTFDPATETQLINSTR